MSIENRLQETVKDVWFNLLAWATHQYVIKHVIDVVIEPNGTIFAPGDLNYPNAVSTGTPSRFITRRLEKKSTV